MLSYNFVSGFLYIVVSIPILGGRSLRPVKNGSFAKGVDQNFSPMFHWTIYLIYLFLSQNFFAYFSPSFIFSAYILNKLSLREGKKPKEGDLYPKVEGEKLRPILISDLEDRSHSLYSIVCNK